MIIICMPENFMIYIYIYTYIYIYIYIYIHIYICPKNWVFVRNFVLVLQVSYVLRALRCDMKCFPIGSVQLVTNLKGLYSKALTDIGCPAIFKGVTSTA